MTDTDSARVFMTARFGALAALACVAVTTAPYIYAALFTPPGLVYLGLMVDVQDHAQYWSWVTAARAGAFISNTMTPEPNPATFINPAMWILARVQSAFDLSFPALFQWWRVAAALAIGPALAVAVTRLSSTARQAKLAFWIALAGGGFGWVLIAAKYALQLPDAPFPEAIYIVEPNTWFGLLAYPYLPLAQGFMLIALVGAFRVHTAPTPGAFLACAIGAFGVAILHAYDLLVVYAVLGTYWIAEVVRRRDVPWRLSWAIVLILVCSAPLALYYQYLTSADPLWRSILAQYANAGVWTPAPWLLVVLMGAPLVLAAVRLARPITDDGTRFTACWAVSGALLVYIPTVFQVKMLAAWQVPLALLAADVWVSSMAPAIERVSRARVGARLGAIAPVAVLVCLVVPTNLYLMAWRLIDLRRADTPYYISLDEAAALDALERASTSGDVALSLESVGRWIPNYGQTRAFLAHWAMTARYFERRDIAARFFSADADDAWRRQVLAQHGVTYVVWTSRDPASAYAPGTSPLFEPVFVAPTAGVYRVLATATP